MGQKGKKKPNTTKTKPVKTLVFLHRWELKEMTHDKIFCNEDFTFQSSINRVHNGGL